MSDPVSLITLGAAVGGVAGKFAEKAWDSAEGWMRERFGSHTAETQEQAKQNVGQFVQQLAIRVKNLEDERKIDQGTITSSYKHPQFSAVLQIAILGAAQTDDELKHDLLARLVANRLASASESTMALASQLAVKAICRATKRQLTLMALACFLEEVRPKYVASVEDYLKWLEIWLSRFLDFEFKNIDARHLVAIGCATYDTASTRNLEVLLWMKGGEQCFSAPVKDLDSFVILEIQWIEGLAGVQLTSVGSIVGGLALDRIMGIESIGPKWDG